MPNSYSYSMLSSAYRCNRLYKFIYVDKLTPPAVKSDALVFGSSVHFALEEFFTANASIIDSFHAYWDSEAPKLEYGRYNQGCLEGNAKVLLERFVKSHAKKIKVSQQEVRLYGKIPGRAEINLEGTPDLLGSFEGIPSVIDFKTSAYRYPNEKIQINEQMYLYAELAKQNGYIPKQLVYIIFIKGTFIRSSLPSIQTLTYELKDSDLNKVLDNITIQCQALDRMREENKFSYNSQSCQIGERKCDFFEKCWSKK